MGVDVLIVCRQNEHPGVVLPWRRGCCSPARVLLGTCSGPSEKARTSSFTAADSTATHRRFWQWHPPQNILYLRVFGGLSTNTCSPPNSMPRGQPSLWRSLVTGGVHYSYSRILAVSPWICSLSGSRENRSTWLASCALPSDWRQHSPKSIGT